MNELISNTCNLLNFDQRWENVELQLDLNYQLPAVTGMKDQIALLLDNILDNALGAFKNFEQASPLVIVKTTIEDNTIIVTVKDNGKGMDKATLEKSMEPFFSTKPVGEGTGLGLALCWSMASSHGGDINMESTKDEGTEVSVLLPLIEENTVDMNVSQAYG